MTLEPNGCGPWWIPKRWKDGYFIDACTIHDKDYIDGKDRYTSDVEFYDRIRETIDNDITLSYWQRRSRKLQAWVFFHIVRRFGWTSHKDGLDL